MADLTSNSQVFSASASEQHATFSEWFNEIIVVNSSNKSVWVNTDGSTATDAEAGSNEVQAGTTGTFSNEQVKTYWAKVGAGGDPSNAAGTDQQNTPASGYGVYVSFISDSSPTGTVVISAQ